MRISAVFAAVLLLLIAGSQPGNGAKILALFTFPAKSHSNMLNSVLRGLLARGHELTVVSNFPLPANTTNYTLIDISPPFDIWELAIKKFNLRTAFDMYKVQPEEEGTMLINITLTTTEHVLRHPNIQRLLHAPGDQHFDLVLVEQFFQDAFLMLGHQFNAPMVSVATFEYSQMFNDMFGVFGAWSHVPHERHLTKDSMSFWQRVQNVKYSAMGYYLRHWLYMPLQQALADKYFAHLPEPRPSLEQLNRNLSALLMNGHAPQNAVRPVVPGLIDVGGLHIADVKPLPADIQAFLDGAGDDGVIFFSLGTQLRSADMPEPQLQAFIAAFKRLPGVRVVWKCEDESLAARLSPNVMVKSWLPQNDILAHPKVRVFITHGGLLGHQEGLHHGVPMLGIPVFADQHQNIAKAEMAGYAIALTFGNVTEASLSWAFAELLGNPRYAEEVQRVSRIFRDRPEKPLDRAVYWIEYVIRHKGAYHLRSAALDLSWFSYMLLDILAAGLAALVVVVGTIWWLVRKSLRLLRGRKQRAGGVPSKKKRL